VIRVWECGVAPAEGNKKAAECVDTGVAIRGCVAEIRGGGVSLGHGSVMRVRECGVAPAGGNRKAAECVGTGVAIRDAGAGLRRKQSVSEVL
jgi:hypothetical protein